MHTRTHSLSQHRHSHQQPETNNTHQVHTHTQTQSAPKEHTINTDPAQKHTRADAAFLLRLFFAAAALAATATPSVMGGRAEDRSTGVCERPGEAGGRRTSDWISLPVSESEGTRACHGQRGHRASIHRRRKGKSCTHRDTHTPQKVTHSQAHAHTHHHSLTQKHVTHEGARTSGDECVRQGRPAQVVALWRLCGGFVCVCGGAWGARFGGPPPHVHSARGHGAEVLPEREMHARIHTRTHTWTHPSTRTHTIPYR